MKYKKENQWGRVYYTDESGQPFPARCTRARVKLPSGAVIELDRLADVEPLAPEAGGADV